MHSKIKFVLLCLIFAVGLSLLADGRITGHPVAALAFAPQQEATPTPAWVEEPLQPPGATQPAESLAEPVLPTPSEGEGLPDLRAMPVITSSAPGTTVTSTLLAGSPTYFDWHFINSGTETAAGSFTVELWVDSIRYVNYPFQEIEPAKVRGIDDWAETVMDPGWHTVRLVVDPGNTVVESDETNNTWQGRVFWSTPDSWRGEYFNNETLTGAPVLVRYDPEINFAWEYGSPGRGVNADGFSARWTRTVALTAGGYEFTLVHDDGMRIWVDGRLALDTWSLCCRIDNLRLALDKGEHLLVVEMFDHYGAATARVSWRKIFDGYRSYMPVMRRP